MSDDQLDLDRIIIDAEYRRRVLARLRQQRASAEAASPVSVSLAPNASTLLPEN